MSDSHHPRPLRRDILAELAQVKRDRDAANERAEHQAALKEQWIEHHDNVVALARKERRRLTAAEQRVEEAERRRRLADEMAERVEHGLCGETNSHGETRAHRDRLVKALENRPSCGWCNGSGCDGKDDCPQCEGTGLTDQSRAALSTTPPEPERGKEMREALDHIERLLPFLVPADPQDSTPHECNAYTMARAFVERHRPPDSTTPPEPEPPPARVVGEDGQIMESMPSLGAPPEPERCPNCAAAEKRAKEAVRRSAAHEQELLELDRKCDHLAEALRRVGWPGGVCPLCLGTEPDHEGNCPVNVAFSTTPPEPGREHPCDRTPDCETCENWHPGSPPPLGNPPQCIADDDEPCPPTPPETNVAKTAPTEGDLAGDETPEPERTWQQERADVLVHVEATASAIAPWLCTDIESGLHVGRAGESDPTTPTGGREGEGELRALLAAVIDGMAGGQVIMREDWERACLLSGRYCEPFLSYPDHCPDPEQKEATVRLDELRATFESNTHPGGTPPEPERCEMCEQRTKAVEKLLDLCDKRTAHEERDRE